MRKAPGLAEARLERERNLEQRGIESDKAPVAARFYLWKMQLVPEK